ncbi:peptidylprolyl isomerase [Bacteroidia bacterium]|nr:peptidylprolyl isomerase [bacterium]MDC0105369.1 peptidylprolyl isomerase [Bacteroidia bacterium]|tara:strand:- start:790 stop:1428 length:639 start_codon:yes stop_codon:yes gene_type:complete
MKKITIILSLTLTLSFVACKEDEETITENAQTFEVLELSTDFGQMYIHLYDETPLHKANFDSLVRAGFYDSTEFHRCIRNFMIQGGDPNSKDDNRGNDGTGGPGYTVAAEIDSSKFKHTYGALAAARIGNSGNPERRSSGSQFYIVNNVNGTPHLDGEYTTFGMVLSGIEVATTIAKQPQNSSNLPNERIKMVMKYAELTQAQLDEKGIVIP